MSTPPTQPEEEPRVIPTCTLKQILRVPELSNSRLKHRWRLPCLFELFIISSFRQGNHPITATAKLSTATPAFSKYPGRHWIGRPRIAAQVMCGRAACIQAQLKLY
jgi:hypothetical protein